VKLPSILLIAAALLLPACSSGIPITVTSIADPDVNLVAVRTFDLAQTSTNDPLIEKNLLRIAERELSARGLVRNTSNPTVLVAILGDTNERREYVPPSTSYTPYYEPGDSYTVTRKRTVNGTVVRSRQRIHTTGDWVYIPHTSPGYERTVFRKSITIRILDANSTQHDSEVGGFDAIPIWEARVINTSPEPDILRLAPLMIREALAEFPTPTGKPSRRSVQRDPDQNAFPTPNG